VLQTKTDTCGTCGAQFTYQYAGGRPPRYCSDSCRASGHRRWDKVQLAMRRAIPVEAMCKLCGHQFLYQRAWGGQRQYCSEDCRVQGERLAEIAYVEARRKEWPTYYQQHRESILAYHVAYRATEAGRCYRESYVARHREELRVQAATYRATDEARIAHQEAENRRRTLQMGGYTERIDPSVIFERDKWVCQICREPVDRMTRYPDPMSASLDHRQPITLLGPHTASNVRLAHLRCNLSKHDKFTGQLRFA
jgi:5-methylcytosine-specific restriction endonuclease McrA